MSSIIVSESPRIRIGFVGCGNMARMLGALWARKGHEVLFGSRTPSRAEALASFVGPPARAGTFADAAGFGDVVVLAVAWRGALDAVAAAGPLVGKTLLDCNNPIDGVQLKLQLGYTTSLAEEIARAAPQASVVKAFNTVFQETFELPEDEIRTQNVTCFVAGDDLKAKSTVADLARELGFVVRDAGTLGRARLLEPAAALIITLGFAEGLGSSIALNAVDLPAPSAYPLGGRDAALTAPDHLQASFADPRAEGTDWPPVLI